MTTIIDAGPLVPTRERVRLRSLWAELTAKCQLECVHCYAGSGPGGTHGTMTVQAWETVLNDAAALGVRRVCFIGGEPTLHPDLPRLVRHALSLGLKAEVYSNLVHLTPDLWELLATPGVRIATSWYTSDRTEHKQITGRDTWRQTFASIEEAVRRGIPLRAGVIDGILPGQHAAEGVKMLKESGVTDIGGDHLREFGRGTIADPEQSCGNCGHYRAAVLPDGSVTPCPLTRWMIAGNVLTSPLAAIVDSVTTLADTLPNRSWICEPNGGLCSPDKQCSPDNVCKPTGRSAVPVMASRACAPECLPDSYCNPLCMPGNCRPHI